MLQTLMMPFCRGLGASMIWTAPPEKRTELSCKMVTAKDVSDLQEALETGKPEDRQRTLL